MQENVLALFDVIAAFEPVDIFGSGSAPGSRSALDSFIASQTGLVFILATCLQETLKLEHIQTNPSVSQLLRRQQQQQHIIILYCSHLGVKVV